MINLPYLQTPSSTVVFWAAINTITEAKNNVKNSKKSMDLVILTKKSLTENFSFWTMQVVAVFTITVDDSNVGAVLRMW